jgi:hypothetical protein
MDCYPAYTAGAFYVALILMDLGRRDWQRVPTHFLLGAFSVLLLVYICEKQGANLGWILLSIPVVFVLFGAFLRLEFRRSSPVEESDDCGCPCCHSRPCNCPRPCSRPNPCQK